MFSIPFLTIGPAFVGFAWVAPVTISVVPQKEEENKKDTKQHVENLTQDVKCLQMLI